MCKHEYSERFSSHYRIKYCKEATYDRGSGKLWACFETKPSWVPKIRDYSSEYRHESYRERYSRIENPKVEEHDSERCSTCKHRRCRCVAVYELYRCRPSRKRVEIYY
ncbi:unnamed protein product [Clonostachys solani]|uniref:Uncharacterized protein n=1 Tax=Clonostachys solani TaxID=160281 RepID=A0A9N9W3B7_9HYPO|nr:unnamed protein product [Clonostachys solani]